MSKKIGRPVKRKYLFRGKKYSISELQRIAINYYHNNISTSGIRKRIQKGWKIKHALCIPSDGHTIFIPQKYPYYNQYFTRKEIFELYEEQPTDELILALFAANLAHLMLKNKTTKQDLGKYLKRNASQINLYLTAKRKPNLITLVHLAQYFHVTTDYFVTTHQTS